MPPKLRELEVALEHAGFVVRAGKGSHRNYTHPNVLRPLTLSGKPGDDAKPYQVKAVKMAIKESAT
ncbi:MAG: type II toxin-antitoxin system HicA family toxin [Beijerinckiaceae bacterium]